MGGGGQDSRSTAEPGPLQIPPGGWGDFFNQGGVDAFWNLTNFPLAPFMATPMPMPVPGMSPLQQMGMQHVYNAGQYGVPTPQAHSQLQNSLIPYSFDVANQQVGINPYERGGLGFALAAPDAVKQQQSISGYLGNALQGTAHAGQAGASTHDPMRAWTRQHTLGTQGDVKQAVDLNQTEQSAIDTLKRFTEGDLGDTAAVRSAIAGIESYTNPQVANKMAAMGLGHSGAAASELQKQSQANLLPVYLQGMKQQESAAGTIGQMGQVEAQRVENAMRRQMEMENLLSQQGMDEARMAEQLATQASIENAQLATQASIANLNSDTQLWNTFLPTEANLMNSAANRYADAYMNTLVPSFMEIGNRQGQREQQRIQNQLQNTWNAYNPMLQLGNAENQRYQQMLDNLFNAGAIDRDVASQQGQAYYNDMLRRQALSEMFSTALLGALPSMIAFPTSTHTSTSGGK